MDDVEAVPLTFDQPEGADQRQRGAEAAGRKRTRPDDHRGPLRLRERIAHGLRELAEQL